MRKGPFDMFNMEEHVKVGVDLLGEVIVQHRSLTTHCNYIEITRRTCVERF